MGDSEKDDIPKITACTQNVCVVPLNSENKEKKVGSCEP